MGSNNTSWCWKKAGIFGREKCMESHSNDNSSAFEGFCPPVWDGFLCWPPTSPSSTIQLECPRTSGNDVTKFAFRICHSNGTWNQSPNRLANFSTDGWTNYQPCFNNYTLDLMRKLLGSSNSTEQLIAKTNIAAYVRVLEMVGLVVSAISLIAALIIFGRFRNLWNNRNWIHTNLFVAMTIQVLARLVVYIDQYIDMKLEFECYTLQRMEYTCESAYTIMEYGKTSMFLWMFIEGLHLHKMITVVFHQHLNCSYYYVVGWVAPIILTSIWALITANEFHGVACWLGYNFSGTYMVLEGPRLVVIFLNLLFLLNIMRVLVTKLRESSSTEAQQVRKAVRAAIVLLPLLGITNCIQMVHSPVEKSTAEFAMWSYGTAFLSTFQGFFCSLIYCFLNGEVQAQVKRYFRKAWRGKVGIPRRKSFGASVINHINVNVLRANDEAKGSMLGCRAKPKLIKATTIKLNEIKTAAASGHDARRSQPGKDNNNADFHGNRDEAKLSTHNICNVIIELVEVSKSSVIIPIQRSGQVRLGEVTNSLATISSGSATNMLTGPDGLEVVDEEKWLKVNRNQNRSKQGKGDDGESGRGDIYIGNENIEGIFRMADDVETVVESDYE